jgi:hypothetical protein
MTRTGKHLSLAALLASGMMFTGCFMTVEEGVDMHPARVTVEMTLGASEALAKPGISTVTSRKMVVVMTSHKGDTLRDTITSRGGRLSREPVFLATVTSVAQTVAPRYDLAPHRRWKISVKVSDARDSLWYSDSSVVEGLEAFDDRKVSMSLISRFAGYAAEFALPAAVTTVRSGVRKIFFDRLTLLVDGVPVRDSALRAGTGTRVSLAHEYVKPGSRVFTLRAYGHLEGDTIGVTPSRLLYQGIQDVRAALGKAAENETVLEWQALEPIVPEPGFDEAGLVVRIGKVHTITVNAQMSGEIDF